ncbi:MAG: glycosyltransferase family A protein [Actinomycetota bacterium]
MASVVITNHDYARFVDQAIESALAQRVPCQVVVVDDGSTDDSLDVIGRYAPAVEVVAQANGGQASAFNAGFERSSAPIVLFLDGDDLLAPDAVEAVARALDDRPEAARCHFGLGFVDADGRALPGGLPEAERSLPRGDLSARVASNPDDVPWQPTSGNAYRASVLRELLPMPTEPYRISADHYLSNLSAVHGPIEAIDRNLGSYRLHGDNADHRADFDLDRARSILVRTRTTRSLLIDQGTRRGLTMPDDVDRFRSLTQDALRLTSFRSAPRGGHPFPGDRWWTLVRRAGGSALARTDLPPVRRALALAWVGALGLAPRPLLAPIASRGLTR